MFFNVAFLPESTSVSDANRFLSQLSTRGVSTAQVNVIDFEASSSADAGGSAPAGGAGASAPEHATRTEDTREKRSGRSEGFIVRRSSTGHAPSTYIVTACV